MKRLAILVTHPIQYYAPVFELLAQSCTLKVFYSWGKDSQADTYDPDFGKKISWDIPLLEGYEYEFLENTSVNPGSSTFKGIQNPDVIEQINLFSPDAILVYGWSYESHLKVMRHFNGKTPVWFRGDSTLLDVQSPFKKIARSILLRWVYSRVDKAFYVGSANKDYFKAYGLKEEQLIFAPHAVDNDRFAEDRSAEAGALRKSLNIPEDAILILFAGKLEPKKDPELLLHAFQELKDPNVHLLFVGNGILEDKLKHLAYQRQKQHARRNVDFLPFQNQSQMPVMYQACDLFVLPSKGPGETWGLAINEAMAAKKAVLTSDRVGCSRDLISIKNGQIFKASDQASLVQALQKLLINKEKLRSLGLHSSKIIKNWTFDKMADEINSALNS